MFYLNNIVINFFFRFRVVHARMKNSWIWDSLTIWLGRSIVSSQLTQINSRFLSTFEFYTWRNVSRRSIHETLKEDLLWDLLFVELIVITRHFEACVEADQHMLDCSFSVFLDLKLISENDHFSAIVSVALEKPFAKLCDSLFPVVEFRIPCGCDIGCWWKTDSGSPCSIVSLQYLLSGRWLMLLESSFLQII